MKKPSKSRSRSSEKLLDKLTKYLAPILVQEVLYRVFGVPVTIQEEYDRELTRIRSVERRLDYLVRVRIGKKSFLVHFEFQAKNQKNMAFRMLEYALEIFKRYGEYPLQVVVYFGVEKLSMSPSLSLGVEKSSLKYDFLLMDLNVFDPEDFLSSKDPQRVLLASLCLRREDPRAKKVFETVLTKINVEDREYYALLLEIISEFKGLLKEYKEVLKMFDIKIEELPSYKEGMQKGMQKGMQRGVLETLLSLLEEKYGLDKKELSKLKKELERLNEKKLLKLTKILIHTKTYQEFKKHVK